MNNKAKIQPVGGLFSFIWYEAEDVTKEVIDLFDKNLYNDFTDYYSDVFEIEQELKIKVAIDEVKNKLIKEIKDEKKFRIFWGLLKIMKNLKFLILKI